jgi:gluconate:H+ symporter, GntP family
MDQITDSALVALGGLIGVVAFLFLAITRFRWHVFIALVLPILLLGLLPGFDREAYIAAFEQGFGRTLQTIAVVIVLGCIMAEALKHTGAIERITLTMIRWVGKPRMPMALTLSGWVVGIPIFCDIGYIVMNPLMHAAALETGLNMAVIATGLMGSCMLTHAIVPPTPGPLAAVALLHADMGRVVVLGLIVTFIAQFAGLAYSLLVGPRLVSPPSRDFVGVSFKDRGLEAELPSTWRSYAPIAIPLLLIAGQGFAGFLLPDDHIVNRALLYLGWPVVALGIGVLLAYSNTRPEQAKARTSEWVEDALRNAAMMLMVIGLGGSLSQILRQTPAVTVIVETITATPIPVVFLPFILAVIGNLITGSATVGVITSATITAPLLDKIGLSPEAAVLAAGSGCMIVKYVNSSYFWVCTSLSRMPLRSALIAFSGVTFVNGISAMAVVYVMWLLGVV